MSKFVHIHSSSRYDRTKLSLSRAVDSYINHDADLLTFTEVSDNRRAEALIKDGYVRLISSNGGFDDCGIMYRKSRFTLLYRESYHIGGGRYAQIAVLKDIVTNKRFVLGVAHYPADVEDSMRFGRRTIRTMTWNTNVVRLRRRVNRLKSRYNCTAALIVADWNLNIKRRWVRARIRAIHPNWTLTWRRPYPAGGTHGDRIIDATIKKGKISIVQEARLLPDDESSDHRPYIEWLRLTA